MTLSAGSSRKATPSDQRRPQHHVEGDMLLAYAAGTLGQAASLVVATHLSLCPRCRSAVAAAEAVGGALLDEVKPEPVAQDVMARALACLDVSPAKPAIDAPAPAARTSLDPAFARGVLPRPVLECLPRDPWDLRWSWVSPGVKFAALLTDEDGARVGLMRSAPGASITPHGHGGEELTLVLSGGYRDGATSFVRGDVQAVDESTIHEPVTDLDGECLSLVMLSAPVKPTKLIARIFRHFTEF